MNADLESSVEETKVDKNITEQTNSEDKTLDGNGAVEEPKSNENTENKLYISDTNIEQKDNENSLDSNTNEENTNGEPNTYAEDKNDLKKENTNGEPNTDEEDENDLKKENTNGEPNTDEEDKNDLKEEVSTSEKAEESAEDDVQKNDTNEVKQNEEDQDNVKETEGEKLTELKTENGDVQGEEELDQNQDEYTNNFTDNLEEADERQEIKAAEDPDALDENVMESAILHLNTPTPKVPIPSHGASAVEQATPQDVIASFQDEQTQPLALDWTFGYNRHVGCINLSDSMRNLILYSASHLVVMYDYENNAQKLLQGHANSVTCISCSEDRRWIVSGDKGKDSTVVVWDSYTGIPVQTIFNVHNDQGCVAITMSQDAKYIATVSAESPQNVCVWDWTNSVDKPICSAELKYTYGIQRYIQFHPTNNQLLVTNSDSQVVFYEWSTGVLNHHAPPLSDDVFNRVVGLFSQSVFQDNKSDRALTATSVGNIVVWEPDRQNGRQNSVSLYKKRALKLVRMQDRSITTLTQTDSYIVTGDVMGQVKFYDSDLNLVNWYQGLNIGPINSLSFNYDPDMNMDKLLENTQYPDDATIPATRFIVKDFVVSTKNAEITKVIAEGSQYVNLLQEHDASVHALAACPNKPVVCIGSYAGLIKLWDFEKKKCIVTRIFDKGLHVQCVAFSSTGLEIAVGMTNGSVYIVDAIALEDEIQQPFRYARDSVTKCVFSHNSRYLATSDADKATTVFIFNQETGWNYLGRYRAHYKEIQDIEFGVSLDSNKPTLLTLGKDRVLVEYDLENSSKDDLKLLSVVRLEQSAVPHCLVWYPPVTKESFLLTSNDQYKFKLFNTTTKMCRKTLLGPTYGSCIKKMSVLQLPNSEDAEEKYLLAYITDHKVGLQMLPIDGNPHKSVATVAHPSGVSHLACSSDGKYLFTAGGKDSSVHMWQISYQSLQAAASLGGEGLVPFYGLLEGGRSGELFGELENYFYFAQLRSQGLNTKDQRSASTTVDIDQVPFIMRALGFYPSEQEIEDMLNEIKFSSYVDSGEYVNTIDLGELIKLYVNHRPAFGLTFDDLQKAFSVLGNSLGKDGDIERSDLMSILQRKGEHMTEHELAENLATLLGYVPEGGSTSQRTDYFVGDMATEFLNSALPDKISATMFSEEILALPEYDE